MHDGDDLLHVLSRRDLRHDAAVFGMDLDLRMDHVGQDRPAVPYDGSRGLIAGAFYREYIIYSSAKRRVTDCPSFGKTVSGKIFRISSEK